MSTPAPALPALPVLPDVPADEPLSTPVVVVAEMGAKLPRGWRKGLQAAATASPHATVRIDLRIRSPASEHVPPGSR